MMELLNASTMCGYSVLINTPAWLTEEVEGMRYEFIEAAKGLQKQALTSQIPLVNLMTTQSDDLEQKVLKSVERIASVIHCFQVKYTGFGFFDAENKFRLKIENEEALVSLRDLLQGELQSCQLLSYSSVQGFGSPQYTEGVHGAKGTYHEFSSWSSTNDFRVDSLSILKKVVGGDGWELVKEVPLGRL